MCAPDHHGETPQSALFGSSSAAPPHLRQCKTLSTHLESDGRKTLSCHAYIYMYTWHKGAYTAQQQRIHVHTRASTALPARCARAESLSSIKTFSKRRCRRSHCSSPGSKESARWPLRARASECRDSKDRQKNANPIGKGGSHPSGKGASSSVKQSSAPIPGRPSTRARPRWCWLLLPLAQTQTEAQTQPCSRGSAPCLPKGPRAELVSYHTARARGRGHTMAGGDVLLFSSCLKHSRETTRHLRCQSTRERSSV